MRRQQTCQRVDVRLAVAGGHRRQPAGAVVAEDAPQQQREHMLEERPVIVPAVADMCAALADADVAGLCHAHFSSLSIGLQSAVTRQQCGLQSGGLQTAVQCTKITAFAVRTCRA